MSNYSLTTKRYSVRNIETFINDIQTSANNYFIWFGRTFPWPDDTNPPFANDTYESSSLQLYDSIAFGKKVSNSSITYAIPTINWTSNTVYSQYDPEDANMWNENFYILTASNNVYKCLYNNNGNPSTVSPMFTISSGYTQTSDGYIWKYMYSIPSTYNNNLGNNFMPIFPNANVRNSAVKGDIPVVLVTNTGINYSCYNYGILQGVVNNSVLIISNNASNISGIYNGSSIRIIGGSYADQIIPIINYDAVSKQVTLQNPITIFTNFNVQNVTGLFSANQSITEKVTNLTISQLVNASSLSYYSNVVQTDTGAYGTLLNLNTSNGVTTMTIGTQSNVAFSNSLPITVGLQYTALNGRVTVNSTSTTVTGNNTSFANSITTNDYLFITGGLQEFRKVVAIANNTSLTVSTPFSNAASNAAITKLINAAQVTNSKVTQYYGNIVYSDLSSVILNITNATASFIVGEVITQNTTANGTVYYANSSVVNLTQVNGNFNPNNGIIIGSTSNVTANISFIQNNQYLTVATNSANWTIGGQVVDAAGDIATLTGYQIIPNIYSQYQISPTVIINGDGTGCQAYSYVDPSSNTITGIFTIKNGSNYTEANVTITCNPNYGSGATARTLIAPLSGHGSNAALELGSNFLGISVPFSNSSNEGFYYPSFGQYRQVGLIKNVLFNQIYFNVNNYTTYQLTTNNVTGIFANNETIIQPSTNAVGQVVFANSSAINIVNMNKSFSVNNAIVGLTSSATANVVSYLPIYFSVVANTVQKIIQPSTNATGYLVSSNTSTLLMTNVLGTFVSNSPIYDAVTMANATVTSITQDYNSNILDLSRFNQLMRITVTGISGTFQTNEVITQDTTNANGIIVSTNSDLDFALSNVQGSFFSGESINSANNTGTGVVLFSNSSYMKITQVAGTFYANDTIIGTISSNAIITNINNVINVSSIRGNWINGSNRIIGQLSLATAFAPIANTITYPDLVRNSGSLLYINNIVPLTLLPTTTEYVSTIFQF